MGKNWVEGLLFWAQELQLPHLRHRGRCAATLLAAQFYSTLLHAAAAGAGVGAQRHAAHAADKGVCTSEAGGLARKRLPRIQP